MEEKKSKILIIGVTGNLGLELAKSSLQASHPTFALIRDSTFSDPRKSHKLQFLSGARATRVHCKMKRVLLMPLCKSTLSFVLFRPNRPLFRNQKLLVQAIKLTGTVKRFIPSEFGLDSDKTQICDLDHNFYSSKAEIRRLVEAENIPYTLISCNFYMSYLLPFIVQPGLKTPPRDKFTVFGNGDVKGVFVKETDVSIFTISAVDDPRTLNEVLYLRPRGNVYSLNELVELWESKIKKTLEKIYMSEEELLKKIEETPSPDNMAMVFIYLAFVKGHQTYFDIESTGKGHQTYFNIESTGGVDGTQLYPPLKYTTFSEHLDTLL